MQPPVNDTGLNGTGSAYPRIIVHKCLCCFLLAAGGQRCRGPVARDLRRDSRRLRKLISTNGISDPEAGYKGVVLSCFAC